MRSPLELEDLFRANGLKVTPQRQCVFRILHDNDSHPSAESLYAAAAAELPSLSRRTVYAILGELTELGEVHAHDLGTGSARFDPRTAPHHHLVCEVCGRVFDLEADFPGVTVPGEAARGFVVTSTEIVFRGRCADCGAPRQALSPQTTTGSTNG